jgi:hypothetical protein
MMTTRKEREREEIMKLMTTIMASMIFRARKIKILKKPKGREHYFAFRANFLERQSNKE